MRLANHSVYEVMEMGCPAERGLSGITDFEASTAPGGLPFGAYLQPFLRVWAASDFVPCLHFGQDQKALYEAIVAACAPMSATKAVTNGQG